MSMLAAAAAVLSLAALTFLAVTRAAIPTRRRTLAGVLIVALAAAGLRVGGSGSSGALLVGACLLLLGLTLIVIAVRSPVGRDRPAAPEAAVSVRPAWLAIHAGAVGVMLVAPHLHLLGLGVVLALVAGALTMRSPDGGWGPQPGQGLALLLFLGTWYALALVGGEASLGIPSLREAPYSEAFQRSLALPLVFAAWPLLGLTPFHQTRLGPMAPVAGGLILVRVVAEAVPIGLGHWQPALYLLVLVAMVHALLTRRDAEALAALAALGLLSGAALVGWSAVGLTAFVALLQAHRLLAPSGRVLSAEGAAVAQAASVAAALVLVPVIAGGLAAEAVYSTVTVLTGAVLLWKG